MEVQPEEKYWQQIAAQIRIEKILRAKQSAIIKSLNPSGDQKTFRNLVTVFMIRLHENLSRGIISYDESQEALIRYVRDLPPHDYDYAFANFTSALDRRNAEIIRVSEKIRIKCGPMMHGDTSPDEIRAEAARWNTVLFDDEISEILRDEYKLRRPKDG
jgi:hypothetical protein